MEKKTFKTIEKKFIHKIEKIKGSEFIAYAIPVKNKEDIKKELEAVKKEYYDAKHHCYAYILGYDKNKTIKYSDDGEPNKTAGLPIFTVLNSYDVTDILVVVIRYFGGIKLGTGGLVKAYTKATAELLKIVKFKEVEVKDKIILTFSYDLISKIYHVSNIFDGTIQNETYENEITFEIELNVAQIENFKKQIIEKTDGKVKIADKKDA